MLHILVTSPAPFRPLLLGAQLLVRRIQGIIFVLLAAFLFAQPHALSPEVRAHIAQVASNLPKYSMIRKSLKAGVHGTGKQQPYMEQMRSSGVKRAVIGIRGKWVGEAPTEISIVLHMYYAEYDSSASRIVDRGRLEDIRERGLEPTLDQVALQRIRIGKLLPGQHSGQLSGKQIYEDVEVFDDPWILETPPFPWDDSSVSPLVHAAMLGDSVEVARLLHERKHESVELDRALLESIQIYRDNTEVIRLLVGAGADVNAQRQADGSTPLILAVHRPAYLRMFIDAGARLGEKDHWGRTALEIARESGETDSAQILAQAGVH